MTTATRSRKTAVTVNTTPEGTMPMTTATRTRKHRKSARPADVTTGTDDASTIEPTDPPTAGTFALVLRAPVRITTGKHAGASGVLRCLFTTAAGIESAGVDLDETHKRHGFKRTMVEATGPAPEGTHVRTTSTTPRAPRAARSIALAEVIAFLQSASAETLDALTLEIESARAAAATTAGAADDASANA